MKKYFITYGFLTSKARYYSTIEAESCSEAWFRAQDITRGGCARAYETKEDAMITPGMEEIPLTPMRVEEYREKENEKNKIIQAVIAKKKKASQQFKLF